MRTDFIKIVEKKWGREKWIRNDALYCIKELHLKRGWRCSLHYHKKKTETFYVVHGRVALEFLPSKFDYANTPTTDELVHPILQIGEFIHIDPWDTHRFWSLSDHALLLECSTEHFDDDSYRLEPSGKVPDDKNK